MSGEPEGGGHVMASGQACQFGKRQSSAAQRPSRPACAPISNVGEKPCDDRGTIRLKNKVADPALVDGQANQWPVELAAIHVAILQFA